MGWEGQEVLRQQLWDFSLRSLEVKAESNNCCITGLLPRVVKLLDPLTRGVQVLSPLKVLDLPSAATGFHLDYRAVPKGESHNCCSLDRVRSFGGRYL